MNTYPNIDDGLYEYPQIKPGRKSPVTGIIFTLAGFALAVWGLTSATLAESKNASSAILLVGTLSVIVGIILLVRALTGKVPVHAGTGEKFKRHELFYNIGDKPALCSALTEGNLKAAARLDKSGSSGLVLTVYLTASGSLAYAQAAEYVPHQFVPCTPILEFRDEDVKSLRELF